MKSCRSDLPAQAGKTALYLQAYLSSEALAKEDATVEFREGGLKLSDEHDWYKWVDKKSYRKYYKKGNILLALENYFQLKY